MENLAQEIVHWGKKIGFNLVAIINADKITEHEDRIRLLRGQGYLSPFLGKSPQERVEPQLLLPGAKSIIMTGLAYQGGEMPKSPKLTGRLASSAWGEDYHQKISLMLQQLADKIWEITSIDFKHLIFVDSKPILEKALAVKAGFGFYGKNSLLINPELGSYVFLGGILTELELPEIKIKEESWLSKENQKILCNECDKCRIACPTKAIVGSGKIDTRRCLAQISQDKGSIPWEYREKLQDCLYGCDICQLVCPYNRRSERTKSAVGNQEDNTQKNLVDLVELLKMTNSQFADSLGKTAAGWRGRTTLQRNALIALGNLGHEQAIPALAAAIDDERPVIRMHAAWAIKKIGGTQAQKLLEKALKKEKNPQVLEELRKTLIK